MNSLKVTARGITTSRLLPLVLLVAAVSLTGCIDRAKTSQMINKYAFEYPAPSFGDLTPVDYAVKVERFSVAKAYNTVSMVYRPGPYQLDTYGSNRWMVNPGNMVSDYLLRDLRDSGLFRGAFSYRDYEDARFVIQGGVEDFLELDTDTGRSALLTLTVTLMDLSRPQTPDRLVFQKTYTITEPIGSPTPEGMAMAMSKGMERASSRIIKDIYQAVREL